MRQDESLVVVAVAGLAFVALCTAPSATTALSQFRSRQTKPDAYEDEDGKSTPEAVAAYSAKLPKAAILVLAATGLGTSLALAILSTLHVAEDEWFLENWLLMAVWGLLAFQATCIAVTRDSVRAYRLGLLTFWASMTVSGILLVQDSRIATSGLPVPVLVTVLRTVELVAGVVLAFAGLLIPRRPAVFYEDGGAVKKQAQLRPVDAQYTESAISRFNFSWISPLLAVATRKNDLDLNDLPRVDHYRRARDVSAAWRRQGFKGPLWLDVIRAHKWTFALQWGLTLMSSVLQFMPQWVVLQLLRILERRRPGDKIGPDAWIWVIWLGVVLVIRNWVESYMFWLSLVDATIPVRAQLSALIFEKSMRRKDVKGTGKTTKKAGEAAAEDGTQDGAANVKTAKTGKKEEEEEEDEAEALKKSKQSTVNLIGVDADRVANFCSYNNLYPASVFNLVVALTFLVSLLGWIPLVAGFSTMLAIMPLNIWASKRYAAAQDRLMKVRDQKTGVVTEALQGIRQIKFAALEPQWERKIGAIREKELQCVWDVFTFDTVLIGCWILSPLFLAAVSLATYAIIHGSLIPSVAFVSLGIFKGLEMTLAVVPELTTDLLDAWVSLKRMDDYLKSPEIEKLSKEADEIIFDDVSLAWPADEKTPEEERFVLRNVSVAFPTGELSVISGKTGSGKTLMLAAILGEADVLSGTLMMPRPPPIHERFDSKATKADWIIPGAIAYVAQIPWIENASIKDNILFGLPYDEDRYVACLDVCALRKDLDMLPDGENTEIGANGINLSGGQRWRVTLARAVYSRAGILVLDDIFSAVDAHVGRHIFERCLTGELCRGRTRILVTHHVALCEPRTRYLVELGDGHVLNAGLLSDLQEAGALERIRSHAKADVEAEEGGGDVTAVNSEGGSDAEDNEDASPNGNTLSKVASRASAKKFVEEETREKGAVKKHIYATYMRDSGSWPFWTFAVILFITVQVLTIARSWWLKIWTGSYEAGDKAIRDQHQYGYAVGIQHNMFHLAPNTTSSAPEHSLGFYLGIYVLLAVGGALVSTSRYFYVFCGSIVASRKLFQKINFVVLRAPLRWLDTVPVGRILNRFTADFNTVDNSLAISVASCAGNLLNFCGIVVAAFIVHPLTLPLAAVLFAICFRIGIMYLNCARPVKRLESTTKSPVFEQFGSALTGVSTIRGFDKTQVYIDRMYERIDDFSTATFHLWLLNRWMGWRMALVGTLFATLIAALILLTPNMDSALAGFALAFALDFTVTVIWVIRTYANLELNMNAAERIIEYTELPTEPLDGAAPPAAWPTEGRVEVNELIVGYAPDLPAVLKGVSFVVERNQRVGVVGRTGAGKSSLTLAIFRFLEARSGSILIDGLDISKINLHDLRSRLAIIPQDPVLFSGTVRSNLDPFDMHTDAELHDALRRVHLVTDESPTPPEGNAASSSSSSSSSLSSAHSTTPTAVPGKNANIFRNLLSPISEGGLNLSQGQRQLLCLARAIVSRPKVMVLDEATSAVDMATDALIQRSIREEFHNGTLLVIAHRLSTIADFDRILVLSDGLVAEYGTPRELWERPESVFRAMCEESGEREKLRTMIFGEAA